MGAHLDSNPYLPIPSQTSVHSPTRLPGYGAGCHLLMFFLICVRYGVFVILGVKSVSKLVPIGLDFLFSRNLEILDFENLSHTLARFRGSKLGHIRLLLGVFFKSTLQDASEGGFL